MAKMSMDTAIRLSAEVRGGANITKVQRSLQDLAKGTQTTAKDMGTLRAATFQYARANDSTLAGIRNSITAFRGLQEQAVIGGREFQRYGAEIQKLEGKLRGLDGTAEKAGASLGQKLAAGLAAAGIGRGLQQITQQAASFDAELRKATAIEGSAGSFDVLRKSVEGVAAAAAGTPAQVAALATALSRAGFSAKETAQAMDGIVKGAEATDTAFDRMGGIAATVLNTFRMNAGDTGRVIDVMVASANSANQTIEDLGEALSYSGSVASNLGVSIEDLSATIALLADAGIRGSRAGTTLSTGLNRLQIAAGGADSEMNDLTRGNAKLAEAMRRLGAEVLDVQGNLRPMDQVLLSLRQQMEGLSTTDRSILAKALFGEEAGRGFLALLSRSEEDITKMFTAMAEAEGTADKTRAAMDSFDLSLKRLGGNTQNLTNQIGGMIGAALKPLVDVLNVALGEAQKLPEPIKMFGAAAAAAGLSVLGLVAAMNALKVSLGVVGGIQAMTAALTAKAGAATGASAAIKVLLGLLTAKALIIGGVVVGVGLFAAALIDAATKNDRFRQSIRDGSVDVTEGRKRLDEMNREIDALQRRLATSANPRLMQSLKNQIRRAREEAKLLNQELEIAAFHGKQGRARGGSPQTGEMYQPGVGYFDLATGQFTRGDDASRSGANAISTPIGATVGSGRSAAGNDKGAEQLLQQQAAAQKQLEDFSDTRAKIAVQLTNELSLLGATTDEARRRLEFDIEVDAINTQNLQVKKDLAAIEEEITRLGGVAETSAIRRQVEREKEQALVNAQVKFEQEINDILLERARMMQGITQQVAAPTAFNELEQQNAQLREMLDTYPAIGQAADAAADLATRGMAEMIAGTKSAKEVFVDFLSGIANALIDTAKRMIAQYIAIGIARAFAGLGSAGGGSFDANAAGPFGGGGLSTGLSFDPSGFGRALGGGVAAGRPYPVGEKGPELFVPYQAGTIIPAEATEALEAINNASLRGLQVPFQPAAAASGSSGLQVPFQRGMDGLSVPFQRSGMDGSTAAGGGSGVIDVKFETVRIGELDFVTRDEAQRIGRDSAKQGAALAQKRLANNPTARRSVGLS